MTEETDFILPDDAQDKIKDAWQDYLDQTSIPAAITRQVLEPRIDTIYCDKKDKKLHLSYYISTQEQREIQETIGDAGVLLYIHYLRMASMKEPDFSDRNTARSLAWNDRKVRRYRGELKKHGWYLAVGFTRTDGLKGTAYHIGKDAVARVVKKKKH